MNINKTIKFNYITSDFTKSNKEEERIIEGYASTHDIDRQYEVITPEAMKKAVDDLLTTNTTVFYEHKHEQFPIGRILDAKVDEKGLWIKVLVSSTANDVWSLIKEGILNKFSIGGKVKNYHKKFNKDLGRDITYVTDMELYEVSIVGLPANQNASFKAKSLAGVVIKALEGREKIENALQIIGGGVSQMGDEKKEIAEKQEPVIEKSIIEPITEPKVEPVVELKVEPIIEKAVEPVVEPAKEITKEEIENLIEKKEKEVKKDVVQMEDPAIDSAVVEEETQYEDASQVIADLTNKLDAVLTIVTDLQSKLAEMMKPVEPVKPVVEESKVVDTVQKSLTAEEITSIIEKTLDSKIGRIRLVPSRKGTIIKMGAGTKENDEDSEDLNTLNDEDKFKTLSKTKQQELIKKGLTLAIKGK